MLHLLDKPSPKKMRHEVTEIGVFLEILQERNSVRVFLFHIPDFRYQSCFYLPFINVATPVFNETRHLVRVSHLMTENNPLLSKSR